MRIVAFCLCILIPHLLFAQKRHELKSPDGNIVFTLYNEDGKIAYAVTYKKQPIINRSFLSLYFKDGDFDNKVSAGKPVYKDSVEDYTLIIGKAGHVHDAYRQMQIPVTSKNDNEKIIGLTIRTFNDGVAFRYEFQHRQKENSFELTAENTTFNLANDPVAKVLLLPGYTTSHEGYYTTTPLSNLREDTLMDMPALFEFPDHIYMAITEAVLLDYAGMYLL